MLDSSTIDHGRKDLNCVDCKSNWGTNNPAVVLAPVQDKDGFIYFPICSDHREGWYDGADFDETEAPTISLMNETPSD